MFFWQPVRGGGKGGKGIISLYSWDRDRTWMAPRREISGSWLAVDFQESDQGGLTEAKI